MTEKGINGDIVYDAICLGTGLPELLLMAKFVKEYPTLKVLVVQRGDEVGGNFPTQELENLFKAAGVRYDKKQARDKFGKPALYRVDKQPKLVFANGLLFGLLHELGLQDSNSVKFKYTTSIHTVEKGKLAKVPLRSDDATAATARFKRRLSLNPFRTSPKMQEFINWVVSGKYTEEEFDKRPTEEAFAKFHLTEELSDYVLQAYACRQSADIHDLPFGVVASEMNRMFSSVASAAEKSGTSTTASPFVICSSGITSICVQLLDLFPAKILSNVSNVEVMHDRSRVRGVKVDGEEYRSKRVFGNVRYFNKEYSESFTRVVRGVAIYDSLPPGMAKQVAPDCCAVMTALPENPASKPSTVYGIWIPPTINCVPQSLDAPPGKQMYVLTCGTKAETTDPHSELEPIFSVPDAVPKLKAVWLDAIFKPVTSIGRQNLIGMAQFADLDESCHLDGLYGDILTAFARLDNL